MEKQEEELLNKHDSNDSENVTSQLQSSDAKSNEIADDISVNAT